MNTEQQPETAHQHGHAHGHAHTHDDHGKECCGHDHNHQHEGGHFCCGDEVHSHDQAADQGFFFFLKIVALLVWAAVLLYFYTTARVDHFLTGDGTFRMQTAIAGLGLIVLAVFNVLNRKAVVSCGHDHSGHSHHEHDHGAHDHHHHHDGDDGHEHHHHHHEDRSISGQLSMLAILLLPVTAAAMTTKDEYSDEFKMARLKSAIVDPEKAALPDVFDIRTKGDGAIAGATSGTTDEGSDTKETSGGLPEFTLEDLESFVKRSDDGNFMISLIELFYSAGDVEVRKVLTGQPVETVAQVVEDTINNPDGNRLRAFRMFMQCCAADSRPVSIAVDFGDAPPNYKEMGWYKLVGTMDFQTENGIMTPILKATSMTEEREPDIRIQ